MHDTHHCFALVFLTCYKIEANDTNLNNINIVNRSFCLESNSTWNVMLYSNGLDIILTTITITITKIYNAHIVIGKIKAIVKLNWRRGQFAS